MSDTLGKLEREINQRKEQLERLHAETEKLRTRSAAIEAEISDLQTACRVVRLIENIPENKPQGNGDATVGVLAAGLSLGPPDLKGMTILQAAEAVLLSVPHGGSMHYKEIAEVASRRGYKSSRSEGPVFQSFWQIMNRNPEKFEATGNGQFRLRERSSASGR